MPIEELPELLRPAIEKYRDEAEERGRPADELVAELRERGAFGVLTPPELGGFGASIAGALDFYARVARIDGPTAWLLWNFNLGFAAGWLPDEATQRLWAGGTVPLMANSGTPGLLTPVEGGYRLSGTWKIVSGAHVAEWYMLAGADPTAGPGFEAFRFSVVPRSEVSVQDTWDVVGMRASDSNSVTVEDVFVPAHMTQTLFAPHRTAGLSVINQLFPGCAAVLIGMAEAAIDEVIALAAVKKGFDGIPLAEKDHVAIAVGRALSQVAAARGLLLSTQGELDRAGAASTERDRAAVRGAIVHVTETARTVLTSMYEAGSSDPLYRTSRLGRIYRDGMAAAQAANLSTTQWTIPGRLALGQPVGWPFV
ncbi:acyl-CoA dehydrogenase family protein [Actinoplanes sp. RD1]|uniref:acyl-CoA dehydrogenase family protein n=1 Tax=Actinoplanes sp. RD1 TaxID=3064538 RepID=UPI00274183E3|nr:acyl-CoA dehydrogenase family protein [Actinoplanes sp. RD1]